MEILPSYFSVLPVETIETIFSKCTIDTIIGTSRTCKQFQALANHALKIDFEDLKKADFEGLKNKISRLDADALNLALSHQKNQSNFKLILLVHLSVGMFLWKSRIEQFSVLKQLKKMDKFLKAKTIFNEAFARFSVCHPEMEKSFSLVNEEAKQSLQLRTQALLDAMQIRASIEEFDGVPSFIETFAHDSGSLFFRGLKCLMMTNSHERGVQLIKLAAVLKHPAAIAHLAGAYKKGNLVPKNIEKSVELFEEAIDLDNTTAQVNYGSLLLIGDEIPCNINRGLQLLTKAAKKGHPEAQYMIGYCHLYGIKVKQDLYQALKWNRRAAKQGDLYAIAQMNFIHSSESSGKYFDLHKGFKWAVMGAQKGFDVLQVYVGYCYLAGYIVDQDNRKAFFWTNLAATQGNMIGLNNLAALHEVGIGTKIDIAEALRLYQLSADKGYAMAKSNLVKLVARITH